MENSIKYVPHKAQAKVYNSHSHFTVCCYGRQWGRALAARAMDMPTRKERTPQMDSTIITEEDANKKAQELLNLYQHQERKNEFTRKELVPDCEPYFAQEYLAEFIEPQDK